jgi:hypothetical protein
LKIEKESRRGKTTIRLSGRLQAVHLEELKIQIGEVGPMTAVDLNEVTLVDVDVVRFLAACEESGIALENCSAYIREWIKREREQ